MTENLNGKSYSDDYFKALFKNVLIPTCAWQNVQDDLILVNYNIAAEEITNGQIKDFLGSKASDMFMDNPEILGDLHRCATEQVTITKEMENILKTTGEKRHFSVKFAYLPSNLVLVHAEDITERKKTKEKLKFRYELETLILQLSTDFINAPILSLDDTINDTLKKIARFANAVRSSLFVYSDDLTTVTNTHEWCADPQDSQIALLQGIPSETFGYYWQLLQQKQNIVVNRLDDLPLEAMGEREWIKEHGFRSAVFVPMIKETVLYGTIGFYGEIGVEKAWPEDFAALLEVVANILVNALERKRAEIELVELNKNLEQLVEERTRELKESEENFRTAVENSPDFMVFIKVDGTIFDVNRLEKGFTREMVVGQSVFKECFYETEDQCESARKAIRDSIETGETTHYEYSQIAPDGSLSFYETRVSPFGYDNEGKIISFQLATRDITERKNAEQELIESERSLRERVKELQCLYKVSELSEMVETSIIKIINGILDLIPPAFQYPEITCARIMLDEKEYITENFKETDWKISTNFITCGLLVVIEVFYLSNKPFLKEVVDLLIELGERLKGFLERREYKTKLEEQNVELEKISELKSEFLRRASHELKTPLISIKGFANLLLELHRESLDGEAISMLNEIEQGCLRLEDIIRSLIKSSKLESSTLELQASKDDLSFLIRFCVRELQGLADARSHSIAVNIGDKIIAKFNKEQMYEVITNLLSNAIKYTLPNGKIGINTEFKGQEVIVSIKDNGIGFTEEEKKKAFQQFGKIERYGQGLDLEIDGTSLGLHISKKIVELHGGKIWLESEGRNKGSTFYFSLPLVE